FDRLAHDQALIYSDNAHDAAFRGTWNYPQHWEKRLCVTSPRRWTPHHPIEIFNKTDRSCRANNGAVDAMYRYWLDQRVAPGAFLATTDLRGVVRPLGKEIVRRVSERADTLAARLRRARG